MPFHFSLSALLRVRESQEKAELQRLQICAARVAHVRIEIESLDAEIAMAQQELLEQAAVGVFGAELQMAAIGEALRKEVQASLLAKLDDLELTRKKQQVRYAEVRQQREILSNLRKRQLSAYQIEASRREQQQVDELFLIRRGSGTGRSLGDVDDNGQSQ